MARSIARSPVQMIGARSVDSGIIGKSGLFVEADELNATDHFFEGTMTIFH